MPHDNRGDSFSHLSLVSILLSFLSKGLWREWAPLLFPAVANGSRCGQSRWCQSADTWWVSAPAMVSVFSVTLQPLSNDNISVALLKQELMSQRLFSSTSVQKPPNSVGSQIPFAT